MRLHLDELVEDAFYYRWTHPDPSMDGLHADVTAAVAEGADRKEDAEVTFSRIGALADAAAGHSSGRPIPVTVHADRSRPPRLTEPWFC
jgi:hypothetical protein